jgi:hypothetical protein
MYMENRINKLFYFPKSSEKSNEENLHKLLYNAHLSIFFHRILSALMDELK